MVICLERGAELHMAQLIPLPLTVSCFSKIQIGFTSLVPAHPGSPGKRAVKRMCVCVCVVECWHKVWSEVQTCIWPSGCHYHSMSLASAKSRLVLPFCYRLTRLVPEKGPLNGCVCVAYLFSALCTWCSGFMQYLKNTSVCELHFETLTQIQTNEVEARLYMFNELVSYSRCSYPCAMWYRFSSLIVYDTNGVSFVSSSCCFCC